MKENGYSVYCEFDAKKHKETFINYLEVMIDKDGTIHYAVPSHQEWAIKEACRLLDVTREELGDMTPKEYYFDWLTWLLMKSGAMAVWNDRYACYEPTREQYASLRKLKLDGIYHGALPAKRR